jgi:hypothetical protein
MLRRYHGSISPLRGVADQVQRIIRKDDPLREQIDDVLVSLGSVS